MREPCGYCPTCGEVTADPLVPVPFMNPDGSVSMLMTARPPSPSLRYTCGPCGPALESSDALAQAMQDQMRDKAEDLRHLGAIWPGSLGAIALRKRRNDVDVLAQELYLAYGGSLKWLRTHDGSPLRRWSRSEDKYAMDDGSSAGELERDAWHAVAKVAFEERATTVAAPLAVRLYEVYREHLGGRSSYAAHEPLPLWGDLKDADLQAWIAVASSVGKSLEVNP